MATVFQEELETAQELIGEYGAACTWTKTSLVGKPSDPDQGPSVGYPVKILFLRSKGGSGLATLLAHMTNSEVPRGGQLGLMASVPFVPELGDEIVGPDGEKYHLAPENGIDALKPDGTPLLWYLRLTK